MFRAIMISPRPAIPRPPESRRQRGFRPAKAFQASQIHRPAGRRIAHVSGITLPAETALGPLPQVPYHPAPFVPARAPMLHLHDPNAEPSPDPDRAAGADQGSDQGVDPPAKDSGHARGLLARGFVAWTGICLRHPLLVLAVAVASAAACAVWTGRNLGYKVSRVDLLDPQSDYNKLWVEYVREFGEEDDAVIVVEGESRDRVIAVLEELSREVAREPAPGRLGTAQGRLDGGGPRGTDGRRCAAGTGHERRSERRPGRPGGGCGTGCCRHAAAREPGRRSGTVQ